MRIKAMRLVLFVVSFPGNPCTHWDEQVRFWLGKTGDLSIVTIWAHATDEIILTKDNHCNKLIISISYLAKPMKIGDAKQ